MRRVTVMLLALGLFGCGGDAKKGDDKPKYKPASEVEGGAKDKVSGYTPKEADEARSRQVGLVEEALVVINEAVRLEPTSYQIYEARAQTLTVLAGMKREPSLFQEALQDLRRARVFYADPMIRIRASDIYRALRQHQRALQELRTGIAEADAKKRSLPRLQLRVALASLALNLKARAEAVKALRELATVDPTLHDEVAQVYEQLPPEIRREVLRGLSAELRAKFGG